MPDIVKKLSCSLKCISSTHLILPLAVLGILLFALKRDTVTVNTEEKCRPELTARKRRAFDGAVRQ